LNLTKQLLTRNDCYQAGRTIKPRGVMVHSTGANNPNTSRYTTAWDKPGVEKCVHAFVGRLPDGSIGAVQTLPWNWRGWHCGQGKKGSANDTHIGFEICEDGLTDPVYFSAVYQEAAELTAYLCTQYGLDPRKDGVVICHAEGHDRGIASNHGDVLHWFPRHGKSMDDFRAGVARLMKGDDEMLSYEQWKEYMERYRRELGELPAPGWGQAELDQAEEMGITDGARPQGLATRQEVVSMIVRAKQL